MGIFYSGKAGSWDRFKNRGTLNLLELLSKSLLIGVFDCFCNGLRPLEALGHPRPTYNITTTDHDPDHKTHQSTFRNTDQCSRHPPRTLACAPMHRHAPSSIGMRPRHAPTITTHPGMCSRSTTCLYFRMHATG